MEKENLKIKAYEKGIGSLPDYPSDAGYTAEMLKSLFDARSDNEIKEKHNALTDAAADIEEALRRHCEDKENPHGVTARQTGASEGRGVRVFSGADELSEIVPEKDEFCLVKYEKLPYKDENGEVKNSDTTVFVAKAGDGETPLSELLPIQNLVAGKGEGSISQLVESEAYGYEIDGVYYTPASSAEGYASVALGRYNKALGNNSMAINYNNEVSARDAFAANSGNIVSEKAEGAFVAGHRNKASGQFQTVVGTYNEENDDAVFVVGGGLGEESRGNLVEVRRDGTEIKGNLRITKAGEDDGNIVAENIVAIFNGTFDTVHAGVMRAESFQGSGASEIKGVTRLGNACISGETAHAEKCSALGNGSAAFNRNNNVHGKFSFAALSSNTIPENLESVFIAGHANTAAASHQAIFGTYASPKISDAFVIGNGTSSGRKNAFAVEKNGNIRIGGTDITLGNTTVSETAFGKIPLIGELFVRIADLEDAVAKGGN